MWRVVLVGLAMLAATSPGRAETVHVQVVDADTGRPIEGAVVSARWATQSGALSEVEVGTDTEGGFTLDRPAAPLRETDGEVVVIYKFGYVVWMNALTIDVHGPARIRVPPPVPQKRPDPRVPAQVRLMPFPQPGDRASHLWVLEFIADADGHKDRRPKLWNAIRLEREAALKEREAFCRNRLDCD